MKDSVRHSARLSRALVAGILGLLVTHAATAAPAISLDASFGEAGVAVIDGVDSIVAASDGKILALGSKDGLPGIYRYTPAGVLDVSFGIGGFVALSRDGVEGAYPTSKLVLDSSGRIYLAWLATACSGNVKCPWSKLARYLPSGAIDTSFGSNGFATLSIAQYALTGQDVRLAFGPDGEIVAAENGYTPGPNHLFPTVILTRLERFRSDGTSLSSWALTGACLSNAVDVEVQQDGAIIAALALTSKTVSTLSPNRCIARYLPSGQLDTSFGNGGSVDWGVAMGTDANYIAGGLLSSDGRLTLATYDLTAAASDPVGKVARFLPNGQLDPAFGVPNGSGVAAANISTIARACGGKFVGAALGHDSFYTYVGLTRYSSNGSVDTTGSGTADGIVSKFLSFVGQVQSVVVRDDGVAIVHALGDGRPRPQQFLIAYRQSDCQHPNDKALRPVVEFYNAGLNHYFLSSDSPDWEALDSGRFKGWERTGYTFATAAAVPNPVCRYYIPPADGDSHFFSASAMECAEVGARFPAFIFETPDAFRASTPNLVTGACSAEAPVPIYRVWNGRPDTNHRYLTDRQVRDAMVMTGWVAEGYGPDQVAMCSPQQ